MLVFIPGLIPSYKQTDSVLQYKHPFLLSTSQILLPTNLTHHTATMQLTQLLLTTLSACSAVLAAPAPAPGKSMMATDCQWTIESLKRVCNDANTCCTWTFGIDTGSGTPTACTYVVEGTNASEANGGPSDCGDFTITSGWSGQFGPGNGFTTLSVVDDVTRQIIYPAYTDNQLKGGQVVTPDQSYTPAALPN